MSNALRLADPSTVTDLRTFAERALVVVPGGYVRLQAFGTTLMATVLVRTGSGLLAAGTVIGMRGFSLGGQATADVLVDLTAVVRNLATAEQAGTTSLEWPTGYREAPWAALTPPRSGWEPIGEFDPAEVSALVTDRLTRVTDARDSGASAAELGSIDQQVWDASVGEGPGQFRAAMALGLHTLGLVGDGPVRLLRNHAWTRLSTAAGDVLGR